MKVLSELVLGMAMGFVSYLAFFFIFSTYAIILVFSIAFVTYLGLLAYLWKKNKLTANSFTRYGWQMMGIIVALLLLDYLSR